MVTTNNTAILYQLTNVIPPNFNHGKHEELPLKSALISNKPGKREDFFVDMTACEATYQQRVRTVMEYGGAHN